MVTTKLMTAEELAVLPDDGFRYELIRGELIQMPPPDVVHGRRQARVSQILLNYADQHGGDVTGEAGFRLEIGPDTVLAPDATYTAPARVPTESRRGYGTYVPDVVVEIDSPSNRPGERRFRVQVYFDAGVRLVLFVNDERQSLTAMYADGRTVVLTIGEVFDGGEIMPGFRATIADLFR
jgi:Uma2 family endonuclease